eukprot:10854966-Alexandrium_andersonii.AAC.1
MLPLVPIRGGPRNPPICLRCEGNLPCGMRLEVPKRSQHSCTFACSHRSDVRGFRREQPSWEEPT